MAKKRTKSEAPPVGLSRCPTGIQGLDEIAGGGLPRGRPTLVCGGAGCGKTLLAMEFLVRGATQFGEPGVFIFFEETEAELAASVASLGFDLPALVRRKSILLDHVRIERSEIEETGEYDATPTLVNELPLPVRRLIGTLTKSRRLFVRLGIDTPDKLRP